MKKFVFIIPILLLTIFLSAPHFVKAAFEPCGSAIYAPDGVNYQVVTLWSDGVVTTVRIGGSDLQWADVQVNYGSLWWSTSPDDKNLGGLLFSRLQSAYIPTLPENITLTHYSGFSVTFYNNYDDYQEQLPDEFQPAAPSLAEQKWLDFYEWFNEKFGYYPREGSLIDLIRLLAIGDWTDVEDVEITFPTLTPTPTPTPLPTPIPVQTIFVPDGNGNTTIVYQYPDPSTGVITQSPYNPNIENNITVNCDCDGNGSGDDNNHFKPVANDPYSMDASLFWADGFGVKMSDNPLSSTDDNQKTLKAVAEEYTSSVEVLSNSFNVFPFKWLELVGLAGGILIIAGLIRTFLGG